MVNDRQVSNERLNDERVARLIPFPAEDAHKYSRGKAVVVAGSAAYPGAVCLAARATQYAGAGYTQVFTARNNVALVQEYRPSLVVDAFNHYDAASVLNASYPGACIIGPGFKAGDKETKGLVRTTLQHVDAPVLLDGGALAVASKPKMHAVFAQRRDCGRVTVVTPHEGEAQRLARPYGIVLGDGVSAPTEKQRKDFARALAFCYEALVVLKGSSTVIASPYRGECEVITTGTAALAKAGTGDVLAGLIGGFLAQGLDAFAACVLGVEIHARAGVQASKRYGVVSTCAEEVLEAVPEVLLLLGNNNE